jgi:hypothetical protein
MMDWYLLKRHDGGREFVYFVNYHTSTYNESAALKMTYSQATEALLKSKGVWFIERYKEEVMQYNYVLKSKQNRDEFGSSLFVLDEVITDCGVELYKLTPDLTKAKRYGSGILPPTGFDKVEVEAPLYERIDKETLLDLLYYRHALGLCDTASIIVLEGYKPKESPGSIDRKVKEANNGL